MPAAGDPTAQTLLGHLTDRVGAHDIADLDVDERGLGDAVQAALDAQYVLLADADRVDGEGPVWDEGAGEWISAAAGGVTLEQVQDDLGNTSLVAGTGLAKTYDDGAGTITLDVDATALEIAFTPAGSIAASDVQAAVEELDTEKVAVADLTPLVAGFGIDITGATISAEVGFDYLASTAVLVNNSTTLTATGLSLPVEASSVYQLELVLGYSADTAADIKVGLSLPPGATFAGFNQSPQTGATANSSTSPRWDGLTESSSITGGGAGAGTSPVSNALSIQVVGVLTISTTAGNCAIQAAQNALHASDLRTFAGSYLKLTKVA